MDRLSKSFEGITLALVMGLTNGLVYALSAYYMSLYSRSSLSLTSPLTELLRAFNIANSALLWYYVISIIHVILSALFLPNLLLAFINRVLVVTQLWLLGYENPNVLSLARELGTLVVGFLVFRVFLYRLHSKLHTGVLVSMEFMVSRVVRGIKGLKDAWYENLPLVLASHSIAASLLVFYTLTSLPIQRAITDFYYLVLVLVVIPVILLILSASVSIESQSRVESAVLGLLSGISLVGLVPLAAILGKRRPALVTALTDYGKPQHGVFVGNVIAELESSTWGQKELWFWRKRFYPLIVQLDRLNTPHIVIVGSSGTGKTLLAKHIIRESKLKYGYSTIVIDPHGEYKDVAESLGFKVVDASRDSVNPLALGASSPRDRAQQLSHIISTIFKLGFLQRGMMEEAIVKAYEAKGIVQEDPRTWSNEPPTLEDLVVECKKLSLENPEYSRILPYLVMLRDSLHASSLISFDELLEGDAVIDLSKMSSDFARTVFLDTFMYLLLSKMYTLRGKKIQLVIDEARSLMPRAVTREMLNRLFAESRKFGFSIVVISQDISRIPRDLVNNAGLRIFFLLNDPESLEISARIISGVEQREKISTVAEALRTLEPHVFVAHITGLSKVYIVESPKRRELFAK